MAAMTGNTASRLRFWADMALRLAVTGLFLLAGWTKVTDPAAFALSIQGYQMVPGQVVEVMAWTLPWLEIFCALALWSRPALRLSGWILITGMLVVFTAAKTAAVVRGLDISCGCTTSDSPLTWWSVGENLIWLVLAVVGTASEAGSGPDADEPVMNKAC
jgi:uncharacterized membrane protein YphA (DoxX/SURF4 family)